MCVCNICIDVKPLLFLFSLLLVFIVIGFNGFVQGVPGIIASLALTKTLALICDIRKGRLSDVPANFTGMGRGSTQEPPRRPFEISIYCTVDAIWNQF